MIISCNSEIARKYGTEEAMLIHNIYFWIKLNKKNDNNYYKGRYWTYCTLCELEERIGLWNRYKLQRMITKLKNKKLLLVDNFNTTKYDKTNWYSLNDEIIEIYEKDDKTIDKNKIYDKIDEEKESIDKNEVQSTETIDNAKTHLRMCKNASSNMQKRIFECAKTHLRICESATPIPDTKTDTKTDIKRESIREKKREIKNTIHSPPKIINMSPIGKYKNIFLSEDELDELKTRYSDYKKKIDRLSEYIKISGKQYKSHYAVILKWARDDESKEPRRSYDIEMLETKGLFIK